MPVSIQTNSSAQNARLRLSEANSRLDRTFDKLSSGLRVKTARDDAAGLAIATRLTAKITGLSQAERNANDAISSLQVAEGALGQVTDLFQRQRSLAIQAANGTLSAPDREAIAAEANQLQQQINDIVQTTEFNGVNLFAGTSLTFQVGSEANQTVGVTLTDPSASVPTPDLSSEAGAQAAIADLDRALDKIATQRAELGAAQSRFDSSINNLADQRLQQTAARSRLQDANIAKQASELVKNQILSQASIATLVQANANSTLTLQLLS